MKLTTRLVRNISFAIMLAVIPLAQQEPAFAATCGPYWCGSLCSQQGGYIVWRGCDPGSCTGGLCGFGENCYDYCIMCSGESEWTCLLPDP
jgi:hypothetical protein